MREEEQERDFETDKFAKDFQRVVGNGDTENIFL